MGYLKSIPVLRKHLKINHYDLVHSHYSTSSFVASISGANPLVVSLMGSDIKSKAYYKYIISFFRLLFWSRTIVKSDDMKKNLSPKNLYVIPNGVDFDKFKPIKKSVALKEIGWDITKKHILFGANPNRYEKNYILAISAFELLNIENAVLHSLNDVPNEKMVYYLNASNVVLLTSLWEGSPNVIKEAMACNIPIVSTDVGDVRDVIGKTKGCYVTSFKQEDVAEKIQLALDYNYKTKGRNDIQHLESGLIAKKIIELYQSVLKQ
jgi:glycosyltransferase involved in cell wall biosynthesis